MLRDVAMDFNIFGEIPSLPVDLDISSPANCARTDSSLNKEAEQGSDLDRGSHMGSRVLELHQLQEDSCD